VVNRCQCGASLHYVDASEAAVTPGHGPKRPLSPIAEEEEEELKKNPYLAQDEQILKYAIAVSKTAICPHFIFTAAASHPYPRKRKAEELYQGP